MEDKTGAKPALDYERKLSDLLVDGEEGRVGGWGEGDDDEGAKGMEALPPMVETTAKWRSQSC